MSRLSTQDVQRYRQRQMSPQELRAVHDHIARNDGGQRVALDQQGNLSGLSSLPPSHQQKVKAALSTGKVKTPSAVLAQLVVKSGGPLRGPDEGLSPVSPVGTIVFSDKPTFSWKRLEKAARYTVSVFDEKENAVDEQMVSETTWTPAQPLPRGNPDSAIAQKLLNDVRASRRHKPQR